MVWALEEFAAMDLYTQSSTLSRRSRRPHTTKVVDLPDEGICFPLKSESDRVNYTLEGLRQSTPPSALELPSADDLEGATVRVLPVGDRWVKLGRHWMRIHTVPRNMVYTPQLEEDGPDLSTLLHVRITFKSYDRGHIDTITDVWKPVCLTRNNAHGRGRQRFLLSISLLNRNRKSGLRMEPLSMHDNDSWICHLRDLGMVMNLPCPLMMIRHHLLEGMTASGVAKMYEAGFIM